MFETQLSNAVAAHSPVVAGVAIIASRLSAIQLNGATEYATRVSEAVATEVAIQVRQRQLDFTTETLAQSQLAVEANLAAITAAKETAVQLEMETEIDGITAALQSIQVEVSAQLATFLSE